MSGSSPMGAPQGSGRTTVVIGGGIAGLATSILLAKDGHRVRLYERNPVVGGRAATELRDGFRFELGPSWFLMPRVFERFFRLAGTSLERELELVALDPAYRVYREPGSAGDGAPVTVPLGRSAVEELFDDLEPGGRAALVRYLRSAARTEDLAERFFLYNTFRNPAALLHRDVVRALPELFGMLGTSLERFVAKRFEHPVIRQILGYPAVFLGSSPSAAPAIYHMMSKLDLEDGVRYPMGGFTALVDALERLAVEAGVEITTEAEVTRISTTTRRGRVFGRRRTVTGVTWRDADGSTHDVRADHVVSGADLHHTETVLLDDVDRSYPERWWKRVVSGPGAVIVTLGVEGALPQLSHHTLLFTEDWHANFNDVFGQPGRVPVPGSIYVCKPSATDPDVAPDGFENLFILFPVPADPSLGAQGDERFDRAVDQCIDQLADWADIPDLRSRIVTRAQIGPRAFVERYHSWRGGMLGPAHILRQSAMFRAQNESRRVRGLTYAGATTAPGVGVPMCLISAELVLKHVRGDRSPGPIAAIPTDERPRGAATAHRTPRDRH